MVNSPSASDPLGHQPSEPSVISIAQSRSACERCRGQKLRCIRNQAACNRCERAGAQCIIGPMLRIGRPVRLENSDQRLDPSNGQRDRPNTTSQSNDTIIQTSSGVEDLFLPSTASEGLSPQHQASSSLQADLNPDDVNTSDQDQPDGDTFGLVSLPNEEGEGIPASSSPRPLAFDLSKIPLEPYLTCFDPHDAVDLNSWGLNFDAAPQETAQNGAPVPHNTVPLEQLSRLNLEFHRHWGQTKFMSDSTLASAGKLSASYSHGDLDSLLPISFMIRGLQKFQEFIHSSSTLNTEQTSTLTNGPSQTDWESLATFSDHSRPPKRSRTSLSSKPVNSRGYNSPISSGGLTTWTGSSNTSLSDIGHTSNGIRAMLNNQERKTVSSSMDLPTQMLLITCHLNLTRFCCRVLHNIRQCLLSFDQEVIFARLSDLLIGGVSLDQDGHLQLFVLIQVVSRMLDAISAALGYSKEYSILAGKLQQGDFPSMLAEKVTTPKLMESVMKEEEQSRSQDSCGGGIKALQEEIWELKKLL